MGERTGKDRERRYLRGEQIVADLEAELVAPEEIYQEVLRICPEAYDGAVGRERFSFEFLHSSAITLLHEAEEFLCPGRCEALVNVAETLDLEALPEDFFRRLLITQRQIAALGRKRPRTRSRDAKIRFWWNAARGSHFRGRPLERQGTKQSYAETITWLAEMFGCSEKSIEAVISSYIEAENSEETSDYDRLNATIDRRYP